MPTQIQPESSIMLFDPAISELDDRRDAFHIDDPLWSSRGLRRRVSPNGEDERALMRIQRGRFHYYTDPVCVACLIIYPINRWYLKPHHIGGWFTHGYLNDVMCLPLFLPMILYGQRLLGLRRDDGWPRWWEILQHWVIFSILFEVILPLMPKTFAHTQDPWNVVAYLAGGVIAGIYWKWREHESPTGPISPA